MLYKIHCEGIIIGLIFNFKQMENYSDFCTSFCVSFANLYFIGNLSFYLYFKIYWAKLFIVSFYDIWTVCRICGGRSLIIPDFVICDVSIFCLSASVETYQFCQCFLRLKFQFYPLYYVYLFYFINFCFLLFSILLLPAFYYFLLFSLDLHSSG